MVRHASRRTVLSLLGASAAAGLAGCASDESESDAPSNGANTSDDDTDVSNGDESDTDDTGGPGPVDSDVIERIEYGDSRRVVVTLADDADVSRVELVDPNGDTTTTYGRDIDDNAPEASFGLVDPMRYGNYEPGEYTITVSGREDVLDEHTVDITPELRISDIEPATDDSVLLVEIENVGTGVAWLKDGDVDGGESDRQRFRSESGEVVTTRPDFRIDAGDSKWFEFDDPFSYSNRDEFDAYCTGEDAFEQQLTFEVEDGVLGTLSGDVTVPLYGERIDAKYGYTCSDIDTGGFPVTLE